MERGQCLGNLNDFLKLNLFLNLVTKYHKYLKYHKYFTNIEEVMLLIKSNEHSNSKNLVVLKNS